jgi:hypothetical protein
VTKHPKHDASDRIAELHDAQDRQLAANLGIDKRVERVVEAFENMAISAAAKDHDAVLLARKECADALRDGGGATYLFRWALFALAVYVLLAVVIASRGG